MKQAEQPISTLALAGVGVFALAIFGGLGGLLYKARARAMPPKPVETVALNRPSKSVEKVKAPMDDSDVVALRIVSKTPANEEHAAPAPIAAQVNEAENVKPQEVAAAAPVEVASNDGANVRVFTPAETPAAAKAEMSDELIPEIKGQSYTMKKALSNGLDPNNPAKPGTTPAKKPDTKKPVVPPKTPVTPPPPVTPAKPPAAAKPEAPKGPAVPALPQLPASGEGKIDFTKAPIYVLNDGRRLRALIVREADGMISIRNEAGMQITFKKSDVKEIVKN